MVTKRTCKKPSIKSRDPATCNPTADRPSDREEFSLRAYLLPTSRLIASRVRGLVCGLKAHKRLSMRLFAALWIVGLVIAILQLVGGPPQNVFAAVPPDPPTIEYEIAQRKAEILELKALLRLAQFYEARRLGRLDETSPHEAQRRDS